MWSVVVAATYPRVDGFPMRGGAKLGKRWTAVRHLVKRFPHPGRLRRLDRGLKPPVLVWLPAASSLRPPTTVHTLRAPSDWGVFGPRRVALKMRSAVRLAIRAQRHDQVILVTAGIELFAVAALVRRPGVTAVDWLIPSSTKLDGSWLLKHVAFYAIRKSDISTLQQRFGVSDVRFIYFPAPPVSGPSSDGDYVYSAGWAHRDWPTLMAALRETGVKAIISSAHAKPESSNVHVLGQLSPAEGRKYLRSARTVVLPLYDTTLPSGPLVLLDAMAHAKPIIVTDVGGSRDYVQDGHDALLVQPGNVDDLVEALGLLWHDHELRRRLGDAAATRARRLTADRFWAELLSEPYVRSHGTRSKHAAGQSRGR